jgi:fructosamine-3-kinase
MSLLEDIAENITTTTGVDAGTEHLGHVSGGDINQAMRVRHGETTYFVKLNSAHMLDMFEAEAQGLQELQRAEALKVPQPVCWGDNGESAWLVMENLSLGGRGNPVDLGEGLAAMHRITQAQFGWFRDNTIGSTPQSNTASDDWIGFWREQRLQYQLTLAERHGAGSALLYRGEQLLDLFPALFDSYQPEPSLLHGDLWSGNYAYTDTGRPAIFDPAVYFGDREADLAMTELFGSFGGDFYAAYHNAWPIDPGYKTRKTLYNLYHVLNHFNLFGGGYASQAQGMMDRLLGELR